MPFFNTQKKKNSTSYKLIKKFRTNTSTETPLAWILSSPVTLKILLKSTSSVLCVISLFDWWSQRQLWQKVSSVKTMVRTGELGSTRKSENGQRRRQAGCSIYMYFPEGFNRLTGVFDKDNRFLLASVRPDECQKFCWLQVKMTGFFVVRARSHCSKQNAEGCVFMTVAWQSCILEYGVSLSRKRELNRKLGSPRGGGSRKCKSSKTWVQKCNLFLQKRKVAGFLKG